MLYAILGNGHRRSLRPQGREPRRRSFRVVCLGGHQHPVNCRRKSGIADVPRPHANIPCRSVDNERCERTTRAENDLMRPCSVKQGRQAAADCTHTYDGNSRHGFPPIFTQFNWSLVVSSSALVKDNRLVPVAEDSPVEVPAHSARKHHALQIATTRNQFFHLVSMRNSRYILLNDGAVIEDRRCVVTGGADQLETPCMSSVVRPCPSKCRQERMVNIDDRRRIPGNERGRKNLHVAREDYQLD